MTERDKIKARFKELEKQQKVAFPKKRDAILAPTGPGVYVIRDKKGCVVHVGRTLRGKNGLRQRLKNHIQGKSSFVKAHLNGKGSALRDGYTFQCIVVPDERERALLEHCATAEHCPAYLGLGLCRKK